MNTFYYIGKNPTVDLVIIREDGDEPEFLMIQREAKGVEVESGKWALPGGFHDSNEKRGGVWIENSETAKEAAVRELEEETCLNLKKEVNEGIVTLKEVGIYEGGGRDPRDNDVSWTSSSAFVAVLPKQIDLSQIRKTVETEGAKWFKFTDLPDNIAFDHKKIIADAHEVYQKLKLQKSKALKM
jgi:ADP-ribose pyrophosphatase YjhB (NUDIX family)